MDRVTIETYVPDHLGRPTITVDPQATLDYVWDWTVWLAALSDNIQSINVTSVGCTVVRSSFTGGLVTAWAGSGAAFVPASITCQITTNSGRTDERTVYLKMVSR
jgi:hypothetical protein